MNLLQILDEGKITDSQGRAVDFKVCISPDLSPTLIHRCTFQNTIICLTSNLGSDILAHTSSTDASGAVTADARADVLARTTEYFPPELLNRLDAPLVFNKLARDSILSVVDLRLRDVAARLADKRITLDVDAEAKTWLAERGYSEVYGARAIARVVRSEVVFPLARMVLKGVVREGDVVRIRIVEDKLTIEENHAPQEDGTDGGIRELEEFVAEDSPDEGKLGGRSF